MSDLAAQVTRLQDWQDIHTLKLLYGRYADIADGVANVSAFAKLFAPDAVFDVGLGEARGPAEIETMMREITGRWKCAMHFMTNPVIRVTGDTAIGEFVALFVWIAQDDPKPLFGSYYYSDEFVKRDGQWLISRVSTRPAFMPPEFAQANPEFEG